MMNRQKQIGLTLIELMIGMLLGLIVVGGVVTVYIAVVKSSGSTIKQSRLNQEMSSIMNIMANDIRRAGFWGAATLENLVRNPSNQDGATALAVLLDASGNTSQGAQGSGDCVVYVYDRNEDGKVNNGAKAWELDSDSNWQESADTASDNEFFGFKLENGDLWMRTSCVGSCGATTVPDCDLGTWERISDPNTITIDELKFDLAESTCVNSTVGDDDTTSGVDESNCYESPAGADEGTTEIRNVEITMISSLVSDSNIKSTMVQTVRVRNDLVKVN